jgi:hypothetical protein
VYVKVIYYIIITLLLHDVVRCIQERAEMHFTLYKRYVEPALKNERDDEVRATGMRGCVDDIIAEVTATEMCGMGR